MLKIKDNVDLKELEKYGFEFDYERKYGKIHYKDIMWVVKDINHKTNLFRWVLTCGDGYMSKPEEFEIQDLLYDLIKNGLVEKVEE